MRRDTFLKSMAALAAAGALPLSAHAAANLKMMIPANPGGGWDSTGRALGKALSDGKLADSVQYENKGGAAGAIGLAQFANAAKGDANSLMVMGAVMLGGIITAKPPVGLDKVTPIARLTSEFNVFVLPANSPYKTMKDVVAQMKKDPGSVKWGGGSRGSTEHIAACMLARAVGVDPKKVNYVAFRGGGEATAAILGGNVTVGGSGYSEFAEYIKTDKMKPIGVTSDKRLKGIEVPTMKEQGYDVVYGTPQQQQHGFFRDVSSWMLRVLTQCVMGVRIATQIMLGKRLKDFGYGTGLMDPPPYVTIKAPVFSFEKLGLVDTSLGPEMKSTGEVLGIGRTYEEALFKVVVAAGFRLPSSGRVLLSVADKDKEEVRSIARDLAEMGFELVGTSETAHHISEAGLPIADVPGPGEGLPNVIDLIRSGDVSLVINTPTKGRRPETAGFRIRRAAVDYKVPCLTSLDTARAVVSVMKARQSDGNSSICSLNEYMETLERRAGLRPIGKEVI